MGNIFQKHSLLLVPMGTVKELGFHTQLNCKPYSVGIFCLGIHSIIRISCSLHPFYPVSRVVKFNLYIRQTHSSITELTELLHDDSNNSVHKTVNGLQSKIMPLLHVYITSSIKIILMNGYNNRFDLV